MRRLLAPWLLLPSLLVAGLGLAQPQPPAVVAPAKPAEEAGEASAAEDHMKDLAEDTSNQKEAEAAAEAPPPAEEWEVEAEEPERFGYADTTGTLENLEDTDGLRVSVRTGSLRGKRGFAPLEVTLQNLDSVPRPLRLGFQGYRSGSPSTVREVELAPRQRLTTYLLVPSAVPSGLFSVEGPNLRKRTSGIYLNEGDALATLVLGTSKAFEAGTGLSRVENSKSPLVNTRFMSVEEAPRELAAYSGFPAVMVTGEVASVPADVWAALENYAAAGGSLILARPPRDVLQRLPLLEPEPERQAWNAYAFGQVYLCQSGAEDCRDALLSVVENGKPHLEPIGPPQRWEEARSALRGGEWPLLPNALVPVGRFLVLIFLFSLVVGPGGLILARRKGPVALLIGVPAVALLTCLIIVGDSLLGDGFVTHASRYSYTWLDRPRDRLVTSAVGGYYANLALDRVQLPSTGVLVAPDELEDWTVDVSWTGGGMVAEGFLPSRTYVEWGELAVLTTRARLVVRQEGAGWKVQNALGAPLQGGLVRLGKRHYALPELADGAEGMATEVPSGKESLGRVVSPPVRVEIRAQGIRSNFMLPLEEGDFMARLGGPGFAPLATLPAQLHEGTHFMRGQVDKP
ncbi:hypothetical protein [Hyalangium gracile]|uniref:hypothetical protein n=1 Tax=Hyalangium gracile TaxID=394092 RepID=UPI001CCD4C7B|nr:hypothetical protein [Hyalangium gracile]